MVVLTGYVVATSPPVAKLINRLALIPATARTAVSFVALMSMSVSFLNWGLSLIFGGLLARAIARRKDLTVDYRALGAAAFMGLGAVWALGLSSSAAQLQATAASLPPALLKITGILDFGTTIFTWQSLLTLAILMALTTVIAHFSAPRGGAIRTAGDLGVDLDDEPSKPAPRSRPGEWFEYSMILPILAGILTLGWLVSQFLTKPFLTVVSSLNGYLLVFLILGLVLHGTPRNFLQAVTKAVPATAGILVQFPLYAAMAAILTKATGHGGMTISSHLAEFFSERLVGTVANNINQIARHANATGKCRPRLPLPSPMRGLSLSGLTVISPTWPGGSCSVIPNITQGDRMAGLMIYLAGPGRANEHEEPHLVAGDSALMAWHDDNELNRDAALDIANALDRAKQFFDTEVDGGHVFHCSLSLAAEEGQLSDERWGAIADEFMKEMDFTG
ncbi:MAG: Short chain fatty acid transporter, partial [Arthrobacter sp.]|nr:Short chain fatty acid transporter [Arthrobacter sp.]